MSETDGRPRRGGAVVVGALEGLSALLGSLSEFEIHVPIARPEPKRVLGTLCHGRKRAPQRCRGPRPLSARRGGVGAAAAAIARRTRAPRQVKLPWFIPPSKQFLPRLFCAAEMDTMRMEVPAFSSVSGMVRGMYSTALSGEVFRGRAEVVRGRAGCGKWSAVVAGVSASQRRSEPLISSGAPKSDFWALGSNSDAASAYSDGSGDVSTTDAASESCPRLKGAGSWEALSRQPPIEHRLASCRTELQNHLATSPDTMHPRGPVTNRPEPRKNQPDKSKPQRRPPDPRAASTHTTNLENSPDAMAQQLIAWMGSPVTHVYRISTAQKRDASAHARAHTHHRGKRCPITS